MPAFKDLTGKQFGRLVVLKQANKISGRIAWLCRCSCGNTKTVISRSLVRGATQSCGCFLKESTSKRSFKHGKKHTQEYNTWCRMKARCYNPKDRDYYLYGAKGIRVCKRWKGSFLDFLKDMGKRPKGCSSIDRIDSKKGYNKANCRWASALTQSRNRTISRIIKYKGKTRYLTEWADLLGIQYHTLKSRLYRYGWSIEKAFTYPIQIKGRRKRKKYLNNI